ncbi:hypothetical protein GGR50DRAFT_9788 [Xylaria sp. CBS 124048]|nr:hypothetical protein GGR50DRAFT_9788 [Xylaria sp. CBS 124048]
MDPLSITTSVITLIGAANNVYSILQSIRHADQALQSLVREVSTLNGFLRSIAEALEVCRSNPYALAHIDPVLWNESKVALSDCQETIDGLGLILVKEPKRPSRSNTLFRRARVAAELRSRAGDIASFREKVSMSNLSLQTLLQVINVSLSLRSNESHDIILRDLQELKDALKKSSQAATASYSTIFLNEHDTRLVHHLKGLIRAAHEFHASASTTASTVMGSGETQPPPTEFGDDDARSVFPPSLPTMKRRQIETFLSQNRRMPRPSSPVSFEKEEDEIITTPTKDPNLPLKTCEDNPSHTFNTILTRGISKMAERALQQLDLVKAKSLLKEALKWHGSSGSEDTNRRRRLHIQLALCSLLQGDRQEAQGLILDLVGSGAESDAVMHQLLYALALLQLHDLDFDGARYTSKRLWQELQTMPSCAVLGDRDAMRLLATSYQETGNRLLADALEAEVPDLNLSEPVPRMVDYLTGCGELLGDFIGLQDHPETSNSSSVAQQIYKLPIATKPSFLQMRQHFQDMPSSLYSPSVDIDDVASTKTRSTEIKHTSRRSWSNLGALFTTLRSGRDSVSDVAVDTASHHSKSRRQSARLRKRVNLSHLVEKSPRDRDAAFHFLQKPMKLKWNWFGRTNTAIQSYHDSRRRSRIMEWVMKQTNEELINTMGQDDDDDVNGPTPQRQFSFRAGIPDDITSRYELADTSIIPELMDTSPSLNGPQPSRQPRAGRPRRLNGPYRPIRLFTDHSSSETPSNGACVSDDVSEQRHEWDEDGMAGPGDTSQRLEEMINGLLGYCRPSTSKKNLTRSNTTVSSISDVAATSESNSDLLSDFDQATQSTSATSCSSLRIGVRVNDYDCDIDGSPSHSVTRRASQQAVGCEIYHQSLKPTVSFNLDNRSDRGSDPGWPPKPLTTVTCVGGATENSSEPGCVEDRNQTRQVFSRIASKLYHSDGPKPPRRATLRRRLPTKRIAAFCKMFDGVGQRDDANFDFGFSNAIYSGPDAVAGPFTDLGETDLTAANENREGRGSADESHSRADRD